MNPILAQFLALTAVLKPAPGTTPEELAELRRFIAAALFQENPGNPVPDVPDPDLAVALQEGAALATTLTAPLTVRVKG